MRFLCIKILVHSSLLVYKIASCINILLIVCSVCVCVCWLLSGGSNFLRVRLVPFSVHCMYSPMRFPFHLTFGNVELEKASWLKLPRTQAASSPWSIDFFTVCMNTQLYNVMLWVFAAGPVWPSFLHEELLTMEVRLFSRCYNECLDFWSRFLYVILIYLLWFGV